MTGVLSLVELCANNPEHRPKLLALAVADFERQGIAERIGEGWRLTDTAAAQFVPLFRSIRPATPVELTDKELADALTPFSPGPQKRTAVAA